VDVRGTANTVQFAPGPARSRRPESQHETTRPRLTLVRPRPIQPAKAPFVLLVVGLLAGGLITLLMLNTALNHGSFELARLRQQTAGLAIVEQTLRQEVDSVSTPQRLAERARQFGMVPADSVAFIDTATGRVMGVPKPATAPPPPPGAPTAPQVGPQAGPAHGDAVMAGPGSAPASGGVPERVSALRAGSGTGAGPAAGRTETTRSPKPAPESASGSNVRKPAAKTPSRVKPKQTDGSTSSSTSDAAGAAATGR
jgi:hypothetical protein